MNYYQSLTINQKINSKGNTLVDFGRQNTPLMRQVKKNFIVSNGSRLKLEPDGVNNNRNYDGPGDDYYSGYYGGDWGPYVDEHRMIEAQKLK
jgi:hypothetical protein